MTTTDVDDDKRLTLLVNRLRGIYHGEQVFATPQIQHEAADTIEELRVALDAAHAAEHHTWTYEPEANDPDGYRFPFYLCERCGLRVDCRHPLALFVACEPIPKE